MMVLLSVFDIVGDQRAGDDDADDRLVQSRSKTPSLQINFYNDVDEKKIDRIAEIDWMD